MTLTGQNEVFDIGGGIDLSLPEAFNKELSEPGHEVGVEISFRTPGPPQATIRATGNSITAGVDGMGAASSVNISFQYQVIQIGPPPGNPVLIPIQFIADGRVTATSNNMWTMGHVTFEVIDPDQHHLIWQEIFVHNEMAHPDTSFNVNTVLWGPVGGIFTCNMGAQVECFMNQDPLCSGEGFAEVDPIIQVDDQIIPGTSANFRDFFQIEFSEGYWALGNPNPTERTTWGQLKRLYD
jgi:hypothetical protein